MTGKILTLTLVFALMLTLAGCSKQATSSPSTTKNQQTQGATPQDQGAISMENFSFSPNTQTVKPGATITVTNNDTPSHTVTADDGSSFDTGLIAKGETKTFTAPTTPGTYTYHCTPHPSMKGNLIVQ